TRRLRDIEALLEPLWAIDVPLEHRPALILDAFAFAARLGGRQGLDGACAAKAAQRDAHAPVAERVDLDRTWAKGRLIALLAVRGHERRLAGRAPRRARVIAERRDRSSKLLAFGVAQGRARG